MPRIVRLDPPATAPVIDRPRPDRLEAGNPRRETWALYESPVAAGALAQISAGIWACEVGRWRIAFAPDKHEVFFVLQGRVRLHDAQGGWTEVGPGESAVIPAGFQGAFEVLEPVRKHFVVVDGGGA
ncbi:MAG: DUF861 domain-containing protein [Burkholderiales bacterium]|nr:DUF861 domain-containing protein [Burkholderiales bacterium]